MEAAKARARRSELEKEMNEKKAFRQWKEAEKEYAEAELELKEAELAELVASLYYEEAKIARIYQLKHEEKVENRMEKEISRTCPDTSGTLTGRRAWWNEK